MGMYLLTFYVAACKSCKSKEACEESYCKVSRHCAWSLRCVILGWWYWWSDGRLFIRTCAEGSFPPLLNKMPTHIRTHVRTQTYGYMFF